jgi:toxin-antitoxin system PIN domain toxin
MFLPDINVWLALAFQAHTHHASAKNWFDGISSAPCSLCRFTQQGLLRLASNRTVLGRHAVTLAKAWLIYDALLNDPRVNFVPEPAQLETDWRHYTQRKTRSPKVWNDAYLAAFAKAGAYEIVTFDQAFGQFKGVRCLILP